MSYNFSTITPTLPTGYTSWSNYLGADLSGIMYKMAYYTNDTYPYGYYSIFRSIDGITWTNPFHIASIDSSSPDNGSFSRIVDTGNIVWGIPVTSGSYLQDYLYYTTDHGITWHAYTTLNRMAWWNAAAGTDGHLYAISDTYNTGIYRIADNLTYTTWGFTASGHEYNSVWLDAGNNVYAQFDNGNLYRFTQTGNGVIYTTLTQLNNNVRHVAYNGSTYLAFDYTNKVILSSPDADVSDWVSTSFGTITGSYPITLSDGSILYIDTTTSQLKLISNDLTTITTLYDASVGIVNVSAAGDIYASSDNTIIKGTKVLTKQLYVGYGGSWKPVTSIYVGVNGAWKLATPYGGLNGAWK